MADTKAQRRDKDYWANRMNYLKERIRQIQEELRDSSTTNKRTETLQTQLKNTQQRILDIRKEHGALGETKMSLTATQKFRKDVLKSHISEDPADPLNANNPIERDKSFSKSNPKTTSVITMASAPTVKELETQLESVFDEIEEYEGKNKRPPKSLIDRRNLLQTKIKKHAELDHQLKRTPKVVKETKSTKDMLKDTRADVKRLKDSILRAEKNGMDATAIKRLETQLKRAEKTHQDAVDQVNNGRGRTATAPKPNPLGKINKVKTNDSKLTRTNTKKLPGGKEATIKRAAQQLVENRTATSPNDKLVMMNTIVDIYDSMTASERKKLDIVQYVSGQDLKRMAKNSDNIKTVVDNYKSEFHTPNDIKHRFALDKRAKDIRNQRFKREQEKNTRNKLKDDAPIKDDKNTGERYTKPKVNKMLKELHAQQERGRKDSQAYKTRQEDIKRLQKILKSMSSTSKLSLADQYRLEAVASSLEETK